MEKVETSFQLMKVSSIVKMWKTGKLGPFGSNRGSKVKNGVNEVRAKKIASNLDYDAFGMLTFTKLGNGYIIVGGHHRVRALEICFDAGNLDDSKEVPVKIIPANKFMRVYTLDAEAKAHTAKDKFSTMKYAQAANIAGFASANGLIIDRNQRVIVGAVFYAVSEHNKLGRPLRYPQVYGHFRSEATKRATEENPIPDFYKLDPKTTERLVAGFHYHRELMTELSGLVKSSIHKDLFKRLQKPGFLGLLLIDFVDQMHGIRANFPDPSQLAKKLMEDKNGNISSGLVELTGGPTRGVSLIRAALGLAKEV